MAMLQSETTWTPNWSERPTPKKLVLQTNWGGCLKPSPGSAWLITLPKVTAHDWHVLTVEDNLVNRERFWLLRFPNLDTVHKLRTMVSYPSIANYSLKESINLPNLSSSCSTVETATNYLSGEAFELLQKTKHYQGNESDGIELSIVLMDLEMPVMNGLTRVRKIREMEAQGSIAGRIPIIAVTANARGEQIVAAEDSGMLRHLTPETGQYMLTRGGQRHAQTIPYQAFDSKD